MNANASKITVHLKNNNYEILNAPGLLNHIGGELRRLSDAKKAAVIVDSNVKSHYLQRVGTSLGEFGFDVVDAVIPAGESHKTLTDLMPIYDRLLQYRIDRDTPIIGLGGGVITDMAGFIAATILRGVPLVQVPTSLLAMVDASVGGKTGVNHAVGKNLIGAFHQPIAVLIDPEVLRTLPARELRGGLAECIKHDIIRDAEGFASLEKNIHRALDLDIEYLAELIAHNVAIKAKVVENDPFEKGERAHLNFGHTFGHAIETVSEYSYSHGESVGLGMVAAAELATRLNMIDQTTKQRIVAVIAKAGLPIGGMSLDSKTVVNATAFDKKVQSDRPRFILPDRIGHVVIRDDVPVELVQSAMESLLG